ncbi:cysteine--tRNA ligase [Candidatus Saccharibacteria bacterium]|nr:MAG: cysteine--tRNA ligase [Candidatus Saccharibacteria bacterium]
MKLYNTLTQGKNTLQTLEAGKIKLYTCGLTVYSQPHIGNWLPYIYWDVLVRTLRSAGFSVEHTQNITDVGHLTSDDDNGQDKMEKGALREGITAWDVANKYISVAATEAGQLGLLKPTHLVRATDMIPQQITFAQTLATKGYLYEIPGDGMYFDTSKLTDYGKLARLDIDGLEAGARVSVEGKKNITDFAVWKFSPPDSRRDMEWTSPWGVGFPGWHLECSVIAKETLGEQIDIHTGGIDHIPVHHTNEIAQTEAVTGKQFSAFWMHANHLKVDGGKMAKSKGNIYTLRDILEKGYSLKAFKVFSLGKHYRTEGNFTWDNLEAAQNRLNHWQEAMATRWQEALMHIGTQDINPADFDQDMQAALANDLDTPRALQLVDEIADKAISGFASAASLDSIARLVDEHLGIYIGEEDISNEQKQLIVERGIARTNKDWKASDKLRDQLATEGIGLRDTPSGAVWYRLSHPN